MMHTTSAWRGVSPKAVPKGTPPRSSITGTMDTSRVSRLSPQVVEVIHSKSSNCNTSSVKSLVLYHTPG